jgi:hypothetical protein
MRYGQFFPSSLAAEEDFFMRRTSLKLVMISMRVGSIILSTFRPTYFADRFEHSGYVQEIITSS